MGLDEHQKKGEQDGEAVGTSRHVKQREVCVCVCLNITPERTTPPSIHIWYSRLSWWLTAHVCTDCVWSASAFKVTSECREKNICKYFFKCSCIVYFQQPKDSLEKG